MATTRPAWRKGVRNAIKDQQGGKCAWCSEQLEGDFQVHHDYRGEKWSQIRKRIESDDMRALGIEGAIADAVKADMFHGADTLFAMHPDCHIEADKAQHEGRLIMEQVRKA
jgi:hypothetical protein